MAVGLPDYTKLAVSSPIHNRIAVDDKAVHRWYRFVLSFPPHLVRDYISKLNVPVDGCILDPFCGTGTTLVECKKLGVSSVGIEASPMAAFASGTKVDWTVDSKLLRNQARKIYDACKSEVDRSGVENDEKPRIVRDRKSLFGLRTLDEEQEKLLLKGSISPLPLHKTLLLLEAINVAPAKVRRSMRLCVAWSLVNGVGNLKFGPEVGVTKPKPNCDVFQIWLDQVLRMAEDLDEVVANSDVAALVHHADSRSAADVLAPRSIDAVITSPPYPNEKDYTRTTRLESVILGLIKNNDELRAVKKSLVRSNTRSVYVDDSDHLHVADFPEIQRIAREIEERRIEMGKTSGFERLYHKVTKQYFGGMRRHLVALQPSLKRGAKLAYVVGDQASYLQVMIRTGHLIAEIAESCGYKVESIDLFRTRLATATREQLREEVVVLSWPK